MDKSRIKSLLESLIFVAEQPLKVGEMLKALRSLLRQEAKAEAGDEGEGENLVEEALENSESDAADQLAEAAAQEESLLSQGDVSQALKEMAEGYLADSERGVVLVEVAGGWQFRTRPENSQVVRCFFQPKPTRISKPGMETLSIIAYRQPITRVEVDAIRGVDSGGVLKTLLEKNLVRIVGKKDEPGKPMLYGTSHEFLELFQLKSLKELPTLRDYRDLEEEYRKKSGEEGVVTPNEEEAEAEVPLTALAEESALEPLSEEEEQILGSLEDNIKEVRSLERDIFDEEKPPKVAKDKVAKDKVSGDLQVAGGEVDPES